MIVINTKAHSTEKETESLKRENLYVEPKSLLRRLIQKLFVKLLSRLFPKKFLFYKNKIRLIMNQSGFDLRFYLAIIYLRFKYPLYFRLPSQQLYAAGMVIKFLEILKPQKIDIFLLAGSLLGAVRQGSFAGRPKDIDLGIKEEQLPKLLNTVPLLIKNGVRFIRKQFNNNKLTRLQILFPCMLIDIGIYRKKNVGKKEMWFNEDEKRYDSKSKSFIFPLDPLISIEAYGKKFMAPANPEVYLELKYGKNWRISDKKQFIWNINEFK